jgi:hypothetical protein
MDAADPTQAQFAAYRAMWDYFNVTLFGGALRRVFLNFLRHAKSLGFFAPSAGRAARPARPATPAVPASRSGSGRRDHDARLCETKMRALRSRPRAPRVARSAASAASSPLVVPDGKGRGPGAVSCVPRRQRPRCGPSPRDGRSLHSPRHAFCSSLSGTGRATSWRRTKAARRWLEPADEPVGVGIAIAHDPRQIRTGGVTASGSCLG